jgi:hypothetical protein
VLVQPTGTVWCESALEWHTALYTPLFFLVTTFRIAVAICIPSHYSGICGFRNVEPADFVFQLIVPPDRPHSVAFVYFVSCVPGMSETVGYVQMHWRNGSVCCFRGSGSLVVIRSLMIPISVVACRPCTSSFAMNCDIRSL